MAKGIVAGGVDRNELSQGISIAVWTTPPGPVEWQRVLELVKPPKVYLFAIDPQMDELKTFLERLSGLVKFALRAQKGETDLKILATATCHQQKTVRMGLLWLEAKGSIQIDQQDESIYLLNRGSGIEGDHLAEIGIELKSMLVETAAYRSYFRKTQNDLT